MFLPKYFCWIMIWPKYFLVDNVFTQIFLLNNVLTQVFLVDNVLTQIFLVGNVGRLQPLHSFFCAGLQQLCPRVSLSVILKHHIIYTFHIFHFSLFIFTISYFWYTHCQQYSEQKSFFILYPSWLIMWQTFVWTCKHPLNPYCSVLQNFRQTKLPK